MKKNRWMIGVSTRQGTTNLVPFFQFSGDRLILLETDHAREKGWSIGPKQVIEKRDKICDVIPIHSGNDLAQLESIITELMNTVEPDTWLWWNIGGGQKLQQLALSDNFFWRLDQGHDDMACYTEPQERSTYIIKPGEQDNKRRLTSRQQSTDFQLDLKEILAVFGHAAKKKTCLWERTAANTGDICGEENLLNSEQDSWFDDYKKRQDMFLYMLKKEKNEPAGDPETIFPIQFTEKDIAKKNELGEYFERIVQTRITRMIAKNPESHRINQVWANVHIYNLRGSMEIAEYDLVLVTNFGTIIPIDAKSYDFKKKDEDARLHNLNKLSGVYTNFWSVFPYFRADIEDKSILQNETEWNTLLRLPFVLKERNSKMLCVSEPDNTVFHVKKMKKNNIHLADQLANGKNKDILEIRTISTLLETLKLEK